MTSQTGFVTPNIIITTNHKKPLKLSQLKVYMLKAYQRDCFSVRSRVNNLRGNLEAGRCCIYTDKGYSHQPPFPGPTERRPWVYWLPTPAPGQDRGPSLSHMADSFKTFPSLASTARLQHAQKHLSTWPGGEDRGLIRQLLKTKELDIWLLLVFAPPPQPAPKQTRTLQSAPPHPTVGARGGWGGGRRQRWGRRKEQEVLERTEVSRQRSLFTVRSSVSGTILRRGLPKAPSNLNGRPYRRAHATERLSSFPPTHPPYWASAARRREDGPSPPPPGQRPLPTPAETPARRQPAAAGREPPALGPVPPPTGGTTAAVPSPTPARSLLTRPSPSRTKRGQAGQTAAQATRTRRLWENGCPACTKTAERCRVPDSAPRPSPLQSMRQPRGHAPSAPLKFLPSAARAEQSREAPPVCPIWGGKREGGRGSGFLITSRPRPAARRGGGFPLLPPQRTAPGAFVRARGREVAAEERGSRSRPGRAPEAAGGGGGRPAPGAPQSSGGVCRPARGRSLLRGETFRARCQNLPAQGACPFSSWKTFREPAPGPGTPVHPVPSEDPTLTGSPVLITQCLRLHSHF